MISEGEPSSTVGRPQRRMAVAIGMNVGGSSPDRSTSGNHFFATASTHFSRMKRMWSKITTASSAFSAIHNAGIVLLKILALFLIFEMIWENLVQKNCPSDSSISSDFDAESSSVFEHDCRPNTELIF